MSRTTFTRRTLLRGAGGLAIALTGASAASALTTMDRNLSIRKGFPAFPMRSCLNRTGPGLSCLTMTARVRSTGESRTSAVAATAMSSSRLQACLAPS